MTIDLGVNLGHLVHLASSFLLPTECSKRDNASYCCSYSIIVKILFMHVISSFHDCYVTGATLFAFHLVVLL